MSIGTTLLAAVILVLVPGDVMASRIEDRRQRLLQQVAGGLALIGAEAVQLGGGRARSRRPLLPPVGAEGL